MQNCRTRQRRAGRWLLPGLIFLVMLAGLCDQGLAQRRRVRSESPRESTAPRDYFSDHFAIHTDMPADEANELLRRLETMLELISGYWGRPLSGIIECFVVRDLANWPPGSLEPEGRQAIAGKGGLCVGSVRARRGRFVSKVRVYAPAERGVPQHEVVHAYCLHTFGRIGPIWYAEGMAELGQYWTQRDFSVNASPDVIRYLKNTPPRSLTRILADTEHSGNWQDYAWRWALCHMLEKNPNYTAQFRALGLGFLTGKPVNFQQTFGTAILQLNFEYHFFVKHMDTGYRADLCAWDWHGKFRPLAKPGRTITSKIMAARGWQPSGLSVMEGVQYEYKTTGRWKIEPGKKAPSLDADGDADRQGRLMAVLMSQFRLGEPFALSKSGTFQAFEDGDLYLRCNDQWNKLDDNSGKITFKVKVKKKGRAGE